MPAVLLHGHPETAAIWDNIRGHLGRADLVALSLPGFGVSRPAGFPATKDAYVDWLASELQAIEGPVDLVGHDWGGILAVRLAATRPDLIRSWVSDALGPFHPDHDWHQQAKVWQMPGRGERAIRAILGSSEEEAVAAFAAWGVSRADALAIRRSWTETMWRCALDLYRSAVGLKQEWGNVTGATRPGLALIATEDHVGSPAQEAEVAAAAGAKVAPLDGLGHWWLLEDPDGAATVIEDFWQRSIAAG